MPTRRNIVRKVEIRCFVPKPVADVIDGMIENGSYSTRSEAVRSLVHAHLQDCLGLLKPGVKK